MKFVVWPLLAFMILLLPHVARAQKIAGPFPNEIGTLYLGNGQVLAALAPRLLTTNAHVSQFVCAPTGTRVAYVSEIRGAENVDESVGVATPESGDNTIYYHDQGQRNFGEVSLRQWSDDAAYLAFQTQGIVRDPSSPGNIGLVDDLRVIDLVHGKVFDSPLPYDQLVPQAGPGEPPRRVVSGSALTAVWAPGVRLIAIGLRSVPGISGICLFDPDRDTCRLLISQASLSLEGWQDAGHIRYRIKTSHFVYDLATGKSAPVDANLPMARKVTTAWDAPQADSTVPAPNNETLSLGEGFYKLAATNGDKIDTNAIVLTRTGGPAKLSRLQLDSFLVEFGSGNAQFLENNGFDRDGVYHVLYECEGDLKVVDLRERAATPQEKLAAGEKLTCPEEIGIAELDARQIGLGILQTVMDNNETFPTSDGFHDGVSPYLKDGTLFTAPNGAPFRYSAPDDLKLADMVSPADTVLGEFDLPCKKIVLYADGHVGAEDNAPAGQQGGAQ